jgi:hypothetical protein
MLYEVPHCDFHHICGDLPLVPWSFWTDLEGFIFIERLFFMALDHLIDIFGLGVSFLLGWMIVLVAWWSYPMCLPC